MKARYIVPLIIIAAASTGALLSNESHPEQTSQSDHHHNAVIDTHDHHQRELDHRDDIAIEDMLHHAVNHLGTAIALPASYIAMPEWKTSWELRWMDFQHGDHTVRIYHATHHNHHATRFVIAVDDAEHGMLDHHWIPVQ